MPEHGPGAPNATSTTDAFARVLRSIGAAALRLPRAWAWIPVLSWAALIWQLSSIPPPVVRSGHPAGSLITNFAHALEYGMLAVWLALLVPRREGWPDLAPATIAKVVAVVVFYAAIDEVHQSFTPHRDPSVFDIVTDGLGAWLTLCVIASAAGQRAAPERLRPLFVWGILACLACAALASFVPDLFPDQAWL